CMGVLSLKCLDNLLPEGVVVNIAEDGEAFDIQQDEDGNISVVNYPVTVNGSVIEFYTKLNAKDNFPFFALNRGTWEEAQVFDEAGNFSPEFIEFAKSLTL